MTTAQVYIRSSAISYIIKRVVWATKEMENISTELKENLNGGNRKW